LSRKDFCDVLHDGFPRDFPSFCSALVQFQDERSRGRGAANITAHDLADVLLLPAENFGNDALRNIGNIEPGRGRAAQIVKV
jgi:hypothetical protein